VPSHRASLEAGASPELSQVTLPKSALGALRVGASLDVVSHGEALVLLREGQGARGYLAGALAAITLGEVFGLLLTGVRTGKLVVGHGEVRKAVWFRDGQIVFASSSEPHERLGRALVRQGLLTPERLETALQRVKPGMKLGQVLVAERWVKPAALYTALTVLVRQIVLDLFELTEGDFAFFEGAASDDALKLPERTRELVLAGMTHGEAVAKAREKFPAARRFTVDARDAEGDPTLEGLNQATVAELRARFEGGNHTFYTWLEDVVRQGALREAKAEAAAESRPPSTGAASALELYSRLIASIVQALGAAGKDLTELRNFFEDPLPGMEEMFEGVHLTEAGEIDLERLMSNAQAGGGAMGRAKAYEALESFVSYALFTAKNALSSERAEALAAEFKRLKEESA
jgi:hypothetical protein